MTGFIAQLEHLGDAQTPVAIAQRDRINEQLTTCPRCAGMAVWSNHADHASAYTSEDAGDGLVVGCAPVQHPPCEIQPKGIRLNAWWFAVSQSKVPWLAVSDRLGVVAAPDADKRSCLAWREATSTAGLAK